MTLTRPVGIPWVFGRRATPRMWCADERIGMSITNTRPVALKLGQKSLKRSNNFKNPNIAQL